MVDVKEQTQKGHLYSAEEQHNCGIHEVMIFITTLCHVSQYCVMLKGRGDVFKPKTNHPYLDTSLVTQSMKEHLTYIHVPDTSSFYVGRSCALHSWFSLIHNSNMYSLLFNCTFCGLHSFSAIVIYVMTVY